MCAFSAPSTLPAGRTPVRESYARRPAWPVCGTVGDSQHRPASCFRRSMVGSAKGSAQRI